MLSKEMVRSIETGRRRDIDAALRRRRLLGAPVHRSGVSRMVRGLRARAAATISGRPLGRHGSVAVEHGACERLDLVT